MIAHNDILVKTVSMPTIKRLPQYLKILYVAIANKREYISSKTIAEQLGFEPIQVRKDLSSIGINGKSGIGFDVLDLIESIKTYLGWHKSSQAFLIGAGNLGNALAGYSDFENLGLDIVAAFDTDSQKTGNEINGKVVYPIDKLENLIQRMHIKMAVLIVPAKAAQQITDRLVDAGIWAIWNFTSAKIQVPDDVIVEHVDLSASLAVLTSRYAQKTRI